MKEANGKITLTDAQLLGIVRQAERRGYEKAEKRALNLIAAITIELGGKFNMHEMRKVEAEDYELQWSRNGDSQLTEYRVRRVR